MGIWRRVRAVECTSLLKRHGASKRHRGFESLRLRIKFKTPVTADWGFKFDGRWMHEKGGADAGSAEPAASRGRANS